jgi:monoamine oxidase
VDLAHPLTDESGRLRVLFAGEATDGSYYGTVHGAMNSAEREVGRISKSFAKETIP